MKAVDLREQSMAVVSVGDAPDVDKITTNLSSRSC